MILHTQRDGQHSTSLSWCLQDMAADERALGQALTGLQAALTGDVQAIAVFREASSYMMWLSCSRFVVMPCFCCSLPFTVLLQKAVTLLHDTELAVRTFQRTHRWRATGKVCPMSFCSVYAEDGQNLKTC